MPADDATGGVEVRRLEPGEEHAAASVLVESHASYPAFVSVFPDEHRRRRALRPFFTSTVRDAIPFGATSVAMASGEPHGVAVWLPPGTFPWSAGRKLRAVPALLGVLLAAPTRFPTFARFGARHEASHPDDDHWYLVVMGIRPQAQRQGLGSRLMAPGLDAADAEGADCYLETSDPRNVAYYERFGFAVTEDALELVPGGPAHVAMRRRAAHAGSLRGD